MKGKTLLSLTIAISMILAALPIVAPVRSQATAVAIVFENGLHEITKAPCSNFNVNVTVSLDPGEMIDFCDVEIHWDPTVLELQTGTVADVVEGPWMKSFGTTVFAVQAPDNAAGILPDIACGYLGLTGNQTGSGVFCTIKFHCKSYGDGNITIWDPAYSPDTHETYLLSGLNLVPIDVVYNGVVHQPFPEPEAPDAEFDVPSLVDVCTNITLDGTGSYPGQDTNPIELCTIIEWKWEINDDGLPGPEHTLYGNITYYHCEAPSPPVVEITLTINSTDPHPPGVGMWADGWETDSETHLIWQLAVVPGPKIDVWTCKGEFGGIGPLGPYPIGWSDAYGPQEEVCVHAKVTYKDEPVEYKPVAFEMINGANMSVDFRTAFTNASGMATVCFRIPWEGSLAEASFGNYSIVGTVDIAGSIVSDTVKFQYGYIVSIRGIIVTGSPLKKTESLHIAVDLKSISMLPRNVFLTIVACDSCGVPIGLTKDWFPVDPEDGISNCHSITIPTWAFISTGTIYVNVFTGPPSLGGVPYCPEGTALFVILKTSDP